MKRITSGCITKINNTALHYSGGGYSEIKTYIYDVEDDVWTRMSDLSYNRYLHGCGSIDAQEGLKR